MVLAVLMVVSVLLLTVLHAVEALAWAGAYVALGARPDFVSAMLYSLSAMTSYGYAPRSDLEGRPGAPSWRSLMDHPSRREASPSPSG